MAGKKLILDVDTGTDDAVAIMLAALHPALDLIACTTVNGNVGVDHCTANTLAVLDHIGRSDIAVHEGMARPLVRRDFPIPRRGRSPWCRWRRCPTSPPASRSTPASSPGCRRS
jgi:inosine-uridine nucleoside N-ribohydrolase